MARTKVKIEMDAELEGMFDGFGVKAASKAASALKKANYLKLGPGRHIIRVLPARKGATSPFSEVWQHMIKPPGGKMFSINCPQKTNGTHCPVCAKVDELRNSDIEADKALGKDMQAKMQISCNAIVRKSDGTEGEIGLLRIPRGVYETRQGRFMARLTVNRQTASLGTFDTPEAARAVYDHARKEAFGDFA